MKEVNYKYNIGQKVNNFKILDRHFKEKIDSRKHFYYEKYYKVQCLIDGYIEEKSESALNKGKRCSVCCGRVIMPYVNDISITCPEIAKLF